MQRLVTDATVCVFACICTVHVCVCMWTFIEYNRVYVHGYMGTCERDPTGLDILEENTDVIVTVAAGLLVVEAQGAEELVLGGAVVHTSGQGQRYSLSVARMTSLGVAHAMSGLVGQLAITVQLVLNVSVTYAHTHTDNKKHTNTPHSHMHTCTHTHCYQNYVMPCNTVSCLAELS